MAKKTTKAEQRFAEIKAQFADFLANNAPAEIIQIGKARGKKYHVVDQPWDDDSVAFLIPDKAPKRAQLAEAISQLLLPARLSAIYHKPDTFQRFQSVVTDLSDKNAVWQEICENPEAFTKELEFDGGFKLSKLLEDVSDISKLSPAVMTTIASNFIYIRNALAHGGEAQAGKLILPTARNLRMLAPWVHLITTVAGQVVLFEHHT